MVAIKTYCSFNLNDRVQIFSCSLFLFASLPSCAGTSLVMLYKFDVLDEFSLTAWSLGLMLLYANGSVELYPPS